MSWDDLRLILSLGRRGSLSATAQELGINVSTCSRRLSQVEASLGVICFIRRPTGLEMTAAGQLILSHAEQMELHACSVQRAVATAAEGRSATVSISCPDSVSSLLVIPALTDWAEKQHRLTVDVVTDNRNADLHRGEAHLAIRLRRPIDGGLRIRKIATFRYGLFASGQYLSKHGAPGLVEDLKRHQLIATKSDYPNHEPAVWWARRCKEGRALCRSDRTLDRRECAAAGIGITFLPLAIAGPGLLRVLPDISLPSLDVYLLAEPGTLKMPAVRSVADRLAAFGRQRAGQYRGEHPLPVNDCEPEGHAGPWKGVGSSLPKLVRG